MYGSTPFEDGAHCRQNWTLPIDVVPGTRLQNVLI
jgi:hypothetical protein